MTVANHIFEIASHSQSIWMDNLSRDIIESGGLKTLIETHDIR